MFFLPEMAAFLYTQHWRIYKIMNILFNIQNFFAPRLCSLNLLVVLFLILEGCQLLVSKAGNSPCSVSILSNITWNIKRSLKYTLCINEGLGFMYGVVVLEGFRWGWWGCFQFRILYSFKPYFFSLYILYTFCTIIYSIHFSINLVSFIFSAFFLYFFLSLLWSLFHTLIYILYLSNIHCFKIRITYTVNA